MSQAQDGLLHFIQVNQGTPLRWKTFREEPLIPYTQMERADEQTPFFLKPLFSTLSESTKDNLYQCFVQFNAEALILLELVLYEGFRELVKTSDSQIVRQSVQKILDDERFHLKAFLMFLKKEVPEFPKRSFLLRKNAWVKMPMLWIARLCPLSLAIPAVKIEAYTIFYAMSLKESFHSPKANSWVYLNHLHLLDETHHVPFEFDLFNELMSKKNFFQKTFVVLSTLWLIFLLQLVFLSGCTRIVRTNFPEMPWWGRVKRSLQLGSWILRQFRPYKQTRLHVKKSFQTKKPIAGWVFSFMWL